MTKNDVLYLNLNKHKYKSRDIFVNTRTSDFELHIIFIIKQT